MLVFALVLAMQTGSGAPAKFAPNCLASTDAAITLACEADALTRRAVAPDGDDDQRDTSWEGAADAFRGAANLTA